MRSFLVTSVILGPPPELTRNPADLIGLDGLLEIVPII